MRVQHRMIEVRTLEQDQVELRSLIRLELLNLNPGGFERRGRANKHIYITGGCLVVVVILVSFGFVLCGSGCPGTCYVD